MKKGTKILIVIGLLIVILLATLVTNQMGLLDTRFWTYDRNVYSEFYNGIKIAGKDIEPGSYIVEIKGGATDTGSVEVAKSIDDHGGAIIWVHKGDKGFEFTLEEGQVLKMNINSDREMRIKKIS